MIRVFYLSFKFLGRIVLVLRVFYLSFEFMQCCNPLPHSEKGSFCQQGWLVPRVFSFVFSFMKYFSMTYLTHSIIDPWTRCFVLRGLLDIEHRAFSKDINQEYLLWILPEESGAMPDYVQAMSR